MPKQVDIALQPVQPSNSGTKSDHPWRKEPIALFPCCSYRLEVRLGSCVSYEVVDSDVLVIGAGGAETSGDKESRKLVGVASSEL